jgi:uncharacterized protein with WD repeat
MPEEKLNATQKKCRSASRARSVSRSCHQTRLPVDVKREATDHEDGHGARTDASAWKSEAMGGPNSWKGDKRRMKRPQSSEMKKSQEQKVGRLQRMVMQRPHPSELSGGLQTSSSAIKKKKHAASAAPLTGGEKRLRTLNKLLRDIEELQRRDDAGEALDEAQQSKLGRLDDVLEEMEELMSQAGA